MRITNVNYDAAVKNGWFKTAPDVSLDNLPGVTELPEMPAATYVWLHNLPGVTALPEMPAATAVWLDGKRVGPKRAATEMQRPI